MWCSIVYILKKMSVTDISIPHWNSRALSMHLLEELGGGSSKNREYISNLMTWLSITPRYTVYRVNILSYKSNEIQEIIHSELSKQAASKQLQIPSVCIHPAMPEVVIVDSWNVASLNLILQKREIIVDISCGIAVLRGSHVFAPGVKGMCRDIALGDFVSVYADFENKCTRGFASEFTGKKYFVGNGIVKLGRNNLFGITGEAKGIAVEMTDIRSCVPSLPLNCIPDSYAMLQNLPSILSCRTLNPCAGERILDMCAAPGNKTTHMAMLMSNEGSIIAIDKTSGKVKTVEDRCQQFGISCVRCFVYDSTKALKEKKIEEKTIKEDFSDVAQTAATGSKFASMHAECVSKEPPFDSESFDRILLDAPCSAMGQRPQIKNSLSLKQLKSYPPLQRKLFQTAVALLKPGGHLVYSTCTVTVAENEDLVKWALNKFPCIQLIQIEPAIGGPGLDNTGLTNQEQQCVRRFGPPMDSLELYCNNYDFNQDTVGFFIAHFVKK